MCNFSQKLGGCYLNLSIMELLSNIYKALFSISTFFLSINNRQKNQPRWCSYKSKEQPKQKLLKDSSWRFSALNYCHKELHLRCWRWCGSTPDYSIWQSNFSLGASNRYLVQLIAICGSKIYVVIVNSYFARVHASVCLSKIELSATKVNDFQCKAIARKSSILDIAGIRYPPLITIFGKVILIWHKQLSSRSV